MKKLISLALVLLLCVGLAAPAFAAEYESVSYTITNFYYDGSMETVFISGEATVTYDYTATLSMQGDVYEETGILIELKPGSTITVADRDGNPKQEGMPYGKSEDGSCYYALELPYDMIPYLHSGAVEDSFSGDIVMYKTTDEWNNSLFFVLNGAGVSAEPEAPAAPEFNDVAENDYFFEPVKWAIENGITDGTTDTTFSPETTCSTAHILTFLWRAMGSPEATIANPFSDISGSEYYYQPALWAYENGLISGTAFGGDNDCTRSMTVTYLWKLAGMPAADAAAFTDVAADAEYAQAVAWAVAEGITDGTSDTTFSPANTCTRGQIVTFLWRDLAN